MRQLPTLRRVLQHVVSCAVSTSYGSIWMGPIWGDVQNEFSVPEQLEAVRYTPSRLRTLNMCDALLLTTTHSCLSA